jgi:hypothetical protein
LVDTVVIGEVQVGKAISAQAVEPLRVATEDIALEGWCLNSGSRTFEIAHHHISRTQKIGGFIGDYAPHATMLQIVANATIKQDVTREEDGEG